ncbi:hypothetical protein HYH03_018829 [Edaphochlamys debaryana]|uniref:Uncharacterized protein n=1 Tax=Edaphochlamys debaryana TaxID=47281 RepID=A0A836BNZ3_9CHLO|nr:hypothetical protein HYH03_018829 [Edaphochlamys debaryana]|eukprot:KAG2482229.1 hypothetical protein HYH03_018829 [Edaphochlamys debaryana]
MTNKTLRAIEERGGLDAWLLATPEAALRSDPASARLSPAADGPALSSAAAAEAEAALQAELGPVAALHGLPPLSAVAEAEAQLRAMPAWRRRQRRRHCWGCRCWQRQRHRCGRRQEVGLLVQEEMQG